MDLASTTEYSVSDMKKQSSENLDNILPVRLNDRQTQFVEKEAKRLRRAKAWVIREALDFYEKKTKEGFSKTPPDP